MKSQAGQEVVMSEQDMELLEQEIFMDCTFEVPVDEMPPQSYATPPMYFPSLGRGMRRDISPMDIPLPQAYYDQMERKRKASQTVNPLCTEPAEGASQPKREDKRTPKQESATPGPQSDHAPAQPHSRPEQVQGSLPPPKPKGRGRGRIIEEGFQKTKPSVVQVRDLANARLPNGHGDVEEGKARLMQMFLGRQSQFELNTQLNAQHDSSGSSIRSAPNFDLKNDKDFPDIISKLTKGGMPFKSSGGGSLDENLRRRARGLMTKGKGCSSGEDGMSSSGDTTERRGVRSSCDADADSSYDTAMSQNKRSSDGNDSHALGGPNVLELMGLPSNLSKEDLGDLLMGCGNIIEMRLLRDRDSGACIGLAYVRMEDEEACGLAVSSYHDIESPFSERYDGDIPHLSVRLLQS